MQELDTATAGNSSGFVQWAYPYASLFTVTVWSMSWWMIRRRRYEKPTDLTFYCDNIVSEDPDDDEYEFARNACSRSTLNIV